MWYCWGVVINLVVSVEMVMEGGDDCAVVVVVVIIMEINVVVIVVVVVFSIVSSHHISCFLIHPTFIFNSF